jgi:hypothetical protein
MGLTVREIVEATELSAAKIKTLKRYMGSCGRRRVSKSVKG